MRDQFGIPLCCASQIGILTQCTFFPTSTDPNF